jgi:very-short-patch-repair endonuclease
MFDRSRHHPPTPSSEEEGETRVKAPSSLEEGVGGGGVTRELLLKRAKEMRANPTEPERRMWMELRDSRFYGFKFRRQIILGWRIVDLFCPAKGLVVEIDGETHDRDRDLKLDQMLMQKTGYRILRFTNEDVMRNMDGVLIALKTALDKQSDRWSGRRAHHPPAPSSEEEGEKNAKAPSSLEEGVGGGGGPR